MTDQSDNPQDQSPKKPDQESKKPEEKKPPVPAKKGVSQLVATMKASSAVEEIKQKEPEILVLPTIPIREGVLFPSTESVLTFGREVSLNALQAARGSKKLVLLVTQKNPAVDQPKPKDLYQVGTLAIIEKTLKTDDNVNTLVRGIGRAKIIEYVETNPKLTAKAVKLVEIQEKDEEMAAMVSHLQKEFRKAVHMGKPVEFLNFMKLMGGVTNGELVDQIASTLNIKTHEKQKILETINVKDRMKLVIKHLSHEMKVLEIEKDVVHKTQEKFDKHMRENILRERLRTIQKELGDIDDDEEIVGEYETRLKNLQLDPKVREKINKEIKRLRQMSPNNPESGYVRTWLDTVFELPWNKTSPEEVNIKKAAEVLDENHYGLEEVKDRILEYIAVMQLKQDQSKNSTDAESGQSDENQKNSKAIKMPTILCFSGPPGVGKTSIGRGIAEALGREFVKISLGGVKDEAEIRGHRRTYVGAMPGKIINGIKSAGTLNPVFMLDEVDKIGGDYKGDPSAALLEALDPEQNDSFEDHYLDLPFDLSKVIFITTANRLDTIPPALLDRLEIIPYTGYTTEEKFHIGKKHLLKKVLKANSLSTDQVVITDEVITYLIERYTREAGVRGLERTLNKIMRKVARELVEGEDNKSAHSGEPLSITNKMVKDYLGPEEYDVTSTDKDDIVGQATGLAFTTVGGDTLFIEVALTPGKGEIKLTGKLGDVMKESAQAALTFVKANAAQLGIKADVIKKTDVHIHVPEGAVPKDGPSAGITITTAIVSAFTNIPVRKDVAMTGEVTLRGRVLRIGGLKEKSIAAHRAGSRTVLIPAENERDLAKIPESVKKAISFIPVAHVSEVFDLALTRKIKPL